jgi:hypothetical protein
VPYKRFSPISPYSPSGERHSYEGPVRQSKGASLNGFLAFNTTLRCLPNSVTDFTSDLPCELAPSLGVKGE